MPLNDLAQAISLREPINQLLNLLHCQFNAWNDWQLALWRRRSAAECVLPTQGRVSSDGLTAAMETAERCFAAAGPRLWNNLPAHLKQTDINFEQFKRLLMRHFCSAVEIAAHCEWLTVKLRFKVYKMKYISIANRIFRVDNVSQSTNFIYLLIYWLTSIGSASATGFTCITTVSCASSTMLNNVPHCRPLPSSRLQFQQQSRRLRRPSPHMYLSLIHIWRCRRRG